MTDATAWAVYLGCNTARRLAVERLIPTKTATALLHAALAAGALLKIGRGRYAAVMTP